MGRVAIAPADRLGGFVVVANVFPNSAREVLHRCEDATGQQVALDLRKPEFDLIEPRRVRRREMDPDTGMLGEKRADGLRLVRGQVVGDDMDLSLLRLTGDNVAEERDERRAGVAWDRLAQDLAGAGIERGKQGQRPVPEVLKAVSLRAARRQGQHRVKAVQRLDRGFLIDREHGGVLRGMEIQPDHVRSLRLEVRIVRGHVALEAVRLQACPSPRLRDMIVINGQQPSELPGTPMGAAVRRGVPGLRQDPGFHRRREHRRRLAVVARLQARQARREEPPPPPIDVVAIARQRGFDRRIRIAVGQHQNDPRSPRGLDANGPTPQPGLKFRSFFGIQPQRHMARQRTSTRSRCTGH